MKTINKFCGRVADVFNVEAGFSKLSTVLNATVCCVMLLAI